MRTALTSSMSCGEGRLDCRTILTMWPTRAKSRNLLIRGTQHLVAVLSGLAVLLASTASIHAQIIHGRLVDSATDIGLDQAFVVLLDDVGVEVNRVITDSEGRFGFSRLTPGVYAIRSERIGFKSTVSEPIALTANENREFKLAVAPIIVRLDTIEVEDDAKDCRVQEAQGLATATTWEEARKLLAAVAWSEPRIRFRYELRSYVRNTNRAGDILDVAELLHTATNGLSYHSLPVNQLQADGYARLHDSLITFDAPDASAFFSDVFLQGHCFNLRRDSNHEGLIGLEFKPVESSEITDVKGVFWLDEITSRIQWLELRYTNVRPRVYERDTRARVEFLQVPNGPWFINRWYIRVPNTHRGLLSNVRVVHGYRETGGGVLRVFDLDNDAVFDIVSDTVHTLVPRSSVVIHGAALSSDSLFPLSDVAVYLDGANLVGRTDSLGEFELAELYAGTYALTLLKEGLAPRVYQFTVPDKAEDEIDLGTVLLSPGAVPTVDMIGSVYDAESGEPVNSTEVVVNGIVFTNTDSNGRFEETDVPARPGINVLEFRRLGYAPAIAKVWLLREQTQLDVSVPVTRVPIALTPYVVEADRKADSFLGSIGFDRRRQGPGRFFTRQDIDERDPYCLSDLLTSVPDISVVAVGAGTRVVRMMRRGGCTPTIYLNGATILDVPNPPMPIGMQSDAVATLHFDIDQWVSPDEVEGVEIYRGPAEVPVEFSTVGSECGVIVIWTR